MSFPDDTPSGALYPELQQLHDRFLASKGTVSELAAELSDEQINWRPAADRWSIGECLHHLIVIGGQLTPRIERSIEKARKENRVATGPFTYGWFGNWFVRANGPTGNPPARRFKVPGIYAPNTEHRAKDVLNSYHKLQDQLLVLVTAANGIDLRRVKITSPVTRFVRLSLGQWFAMLAGHQERHLQQASHVKQLMVKTTASE